MSQAKRLIALASATLCGLIAVAATGTAAHAAPYDGVNPDGHSCNNSQTRTVYTANVRITSGAILGRIELRYSPTCRTVWGRLVNYMNRQPGDSHDGSPFIHRNSDGAERGRVECDRASGTNTVCWTTMLNDAGVTSYAFGRIDGYPTYGYAQAYGRTSSY